MKIYQLFRERPSDVLLAKILFAFGLRDINDESCFSKTDLIKHGTVPKLNSIIHELESLYLPCKAREYLIDITEKKALTVLRQLLRLYGRKLGIKQKYLSYKKVIYYFISFEGDDDKIPNIKFKQEACTVKFS
jgi:hypothetical protein